MSALPRCSVFNGTVLPNKPDFDATKYPNWMILYGTNSTTGEKQYIWLACSKPFLKYAEGVYVYPADSEIIGFGANKSTCTWNSGTITKDEGVADYYTFSGTYVWSFMPIYLHSDQTVIAHQAGDMVTDWDAEEPTITALTGAGTAESPTAYWTGDTATALTCAATVSDGGTLSYKWYRNGTYVGSGNSYTPSTATAGQFAYYCIVTNTLTGASGFSDIDTVQSESMVIVVTAKEEPDTPDTPVVPDVKASKHKHIIGYVLRQCGVPMAEMIAEMLGKVKKTSSLYLYGTPSTSGDIGLRNGDSVTLYDGDLLPDINKLLTDEQMAKYPFMWISRIGGRRRRMIALPKVEVRYSNLVHWFGLFDGDESYVAAVYQNGQWGEIEENVNTNTNTYVGADMWKNFDIVYENEVLSSASPDPIQVSSMVGYSYNGAVLPEMPDSSYEYACITTNTNGYANLIISSTQLRYTNGIGFYAASDGACTIYTYRDGVNSEWVWNKDSTYEAQGLVYFTGQSLKWANYEMYNNNDGSLALDASDFVPVYE